MPDPREATPPPEPSLAVTGGNDTHVAPLLPATAPTPEPARNVNFFTALLLFWIVPKRYGPHLAVGSWTGALLAHVLSILTAGVSLLLVAISQSQLHTSKLGLREQLAQFVLETAARSAASGGTTDWVTAALFALALPLLELAMLLLAILIMPWYAGGDRAGSVFKRSLKSVYWSTTFLIPVTIAVCGLVLYSVDPEKLLQRYSDLFVAALILVGVGLPLVMFVRMLLTGGARYVGKPDGPAFAPREPHCEDCGYLIVGLPLDSRCPECGLSVAESLPGGRRRPTVWQENELKPAGFLDLLRLQRAVFTQKDFFARLPVHSGLSAARHFWWGTWCLMLLVPLVVLQAIARADWDYGAPPGLIMTGTLFAIFLPLLLQALMMFAACFYGQIRYGIRDYRNSAIVCYYASPLMWLPAMLWLLALLPEWRPLRDWLAGPSILAHLLPGSIDGVEVYLLALLLVFLLLVLVWWLRLCRGLRAIQHANV